MHRNITVINYIYVYMCICVVIYIAIQAGVVLGDFADFQTPFRFTELT